jgi:hypothetical protein
MKINSQSTNERAKQQQKRRQRLLKCIKKANGNLPPDFEGMIFVQFVREGRGFDADFAWAIYISHNPCHDRIGYKDDRNTVIAFHRTKGIFRIIGRELPKKLARKIAEGEI